jgi:hypothetical protein
MRNPERNGFDSEDLAQAELELAEIPTHGPIFDGEEGRGRGNMMDGWMNAMQCKH